MPTLLHRLAAPLRLCAALGLIVIAMPAAASDADLSDRLLQGGHALMMRHAYAPGIGDPDHFRLDDCATQRNLDATGRAQAAAAGDWLRARGVRAARVYASQWCRTLETARLLGLGPVTPLPALNSFFQRPEDSAPTTRALLDFLATQPADGPLLVLVTHQVNISAVTGSGLGSGEAVLLQLQPGAPPRVVGRVDFR